MAGYVIQYYNEQLTQGQWRPISLTSSSTGALIPPTDTVATLDVTGLRTGMLSIWAYDEAGNAGRSLSQLIRITDYHAPSAPDSLRAEVLPTGHVILSWLPRPEDTDIAYYDLAFANDSTHEFLLVNQGGIPDALYIDSLALDANQKYIYYKVRAVDNESNFGEWSPALQVLRPHNTPPTTPHLDESWHRTVLPPNASQNDHLGMHMRWIMGTDADMTYHVLWRRLGTEGEWQAIARWDADSLRQTGNFAVVVDDNPPYHQTERYYYMVESFNSTPFTSRSMAVSWLHTGPRVLNIPVSLAGDWIESEHLVRLVWEVPASQTDWLATAGDYYFCIHRKTDSEQRFRYVTNVAPDAVDFTDRSLKTGQKAEYYVTIRFTDGRVGQPSNTIQVEAKNK